LKFTGPLPGRVVNEHGTLSLSDPAAISTGGQTFTARLPIANLSKADAGDFDGLDGFIGWTEVRDNLLLFDRAKRVVRAIDAMPPETAGWLKLKIHPGKTLLLDIAMPDGKTGTILVDTGAPEGVQLPPGQFKAWRAAHPGLPSITGTYSTVGADLQTTEEVRADEIAVGNLKLLDVLVSNAGPVDGHDIEGFAGTLGLSALARMDLIVDNKGGFAWLRPDTQREHVGWFGRKRANWTVAANVRVKRETILEACAMDSGWLDISKVAYAAAVADFDRAIELDPTDAEAFRERAAARLSLNDFKAETADLDCAIALEPGDADAYDSRGTARELQGDFSGAAAD
jgi:hypothetical protein